MLNRVGKIKQKDFFILILIKKQMNTKSHEGSIRKRILDRTPDGVLVDEYIDARDFIALIRAPKLTMGMLYSHRSNLWFLPDSVITASSEPSISSIKGVFELLSLVEKVNHLLNESTYCGRLWRDGERSVLQVFTAH